MWQDQEKGQPIVRKRETNSILRRIATQHLFHHGYGCPLRPITWFLVHGLPHCARHITSHSKSGSSIFAISDHNDHRRPLARGWEHQNMLYSTSSVPTDLNEEAHIAFAKADEVHSSQSITLSPRITVEVGPLTISIAPLPSLRLNRYPRTLSARDPHSRRISLRKQRRPGIAPSRSTTPSFSKAPSKCPWIMATHGSWARGISW